MYNNAIQSVETEINAMLEQRVEGARIRSKVTMLDNNEKPSRFFMRTEKSRAKKKHIATLNVNGTIVTAPTEIVNSCSDFYRDLYMAKNIDTNLLDYFFR